MSPAIAYELRIGLHCHRNRKVLAHVDLHHGRAQIDKSSGSSSSGA